MNVHLDERIRALAAKSGAVYTRYGDDLTFSWSSGRMPAGFMDAVEAALGSAGYDVQPLKGWRIRSIRDRPVVTGLVLVGEGRIRVPWAVRLRIALLRWRTWWPGGEDAEAQRRGYAGCLRSVER